MFSDGVVSGTLEKKVARPFGLCVWQKREVSVDAEAEVAPFAIVRDRTMWPHPSGLRAAVRTLLQRGGPGSADPGRHSDYATAVSEAEPAAKREARPRPKYHPSRRPSAEAAGRGAGPSGRAQGPRRAQARKNMP